jgi:TDG/mug DNA glycosylase family protein
MVRVRGPPADAQRSRVLRALLRVEVHGGHGEGLAAGASRPGSGWLGRGRAPAHAPRASSRRARSRSGLTEPAVPDVLAPGLRIVFCGINPGRASAAAGAHFANPRNDFWRLLHAAGFTPRLLEPSEQFELLALGIGLTNAARRTTRGSSELRAADFSGARERLEEVGRTLRPGIIGFVGKAAYQGVFRERPEHGLQERALDGVPLFVLPSTSPANAAVPWEERLRWFRALRAVVVP